MFDFNASMIKLKTIYFLFQSVDDTCAVISVYVNEGELKLADSRWIKFTVKCFYTLTLKCNIFV